MTTPKTSPKKYSDPVGRFCGCGKLQHGGRVSRHHRLLDWSWIDRAGAAGLADGNSLHRLLPIRALTPSAGLWILGATLPGLFASLAMTGHVNILPESSEYIIRLLTYWFLKGIGTSGGF